VSIFSGLSPVVLNNWEAAFPDAILTPNDRSYLKAMRSENRLQSKREMREDFLNAVIVEMDKSDDNPLLDAAYRAVLNWKGKKRPVLQGGKIRNKDLSSRWMNIIEWDNFSRRIGDSGIVPGLDFESSIHNDGLKRYGMFIRWYKNQFGILWITDYETVKNLNSAYDIAVRLGLSHLDENSVLVMVSFEPPSTKIAFFPSVIDAAGYDAFFPCDTGSKTGLARDLETGDFSGFSEWIMEGFDDLNKECGNPDFEFPDSRNIARPLPEGYLRNFPK